MVIVFIISPFEGMRTSESAPTQLDQELAVISGFVGQGPNNGRAHDTVSCWNHIFVYEFMRKNV